MSIELKKRLLSLLIRSDDYTTANKLAQKLDVSPRTIYVYLDGLDELLKQHKCKMKKVPGKGIILKGSLNNRRELSQSIDQTESDDLDPIMRQLSIVKMLLNDERFSYQQLADKYFVSRSTIVKDFKNIRELFLTKDIDIIFSNKGSKIIATESNIQKTWIKILSFQYEYICGQPPHDPLHYSCFLQNECSLDKQAMDELLNEVNLMGNNYELADHYRIHLLESLTVFFYRVSRGYHLKENSDYIFEKVKDLETYYIAHNIAESLHEIEGDYYTIEDTLYINECLIASGIKNKINAAHRLYFERIADLFIDRISNILNDDFSDDSKLKEGLINHLIPMYFRLKNNIKMQNPYISEIKKQYSMMFHMTWYVVVDIEKEIGNKIPEDEIAFLMIHFQSALERRREIKKILIGRKTGLLTGEILTRRIRRVLPSIHIYEDITEEEIKKRDLSKVDLIISTIPINITEPPVISINPMLSDAELRELEKQVTELFSKHSILSYKDKHCLNEHPIILSFKDQLIIERDSVSSMEEGLNRLLTPLENENSVENEYRKSVFDREIMSSTSFETGVAIPHGNPNYVNETQINILINDKKISWGDKKVDLIILLSVAKSDIHSIGFFIERLYDVIQSRDELERVFFNQSASSIYHYFARYN